MAALKLIRYTGTIDDTTDCMLAIPADLQRRCCTVPLLHCYFLSQTDLKHSQHYKNEIKPCENLTSDHDYSTNQIYNKFLRSKTLEEIVSR
jgi:hypothetical protein